MITSFLTGFATGFTLILAIGAQNAFVLRQGLARSHVFLLCLFCAVSDAVLIIAGVLGFGAIVARYPEMPLIMAWAGALFLLIYGAMRFWSAYQGEYAMQVSGKTGGLLATILTAAGFTWLNPHVYLDTIGLIGAVSTDFAGSLRTAYAVGAVSASFVFFFSLGYGARLLSPYMQSPRSWQVLDVMIGVVMWALAVKLIS